MVSLFTFLTLMQICLIDEDNVFPFNHDAGFRVDPDLFNHFKEIANLTNFIKSTIDP